MGKIILEDLLFFAYHGVFEEEKILGTHFKVDLVIETSFKKVFESDSIADTINYQDVYAIVEREMMIPSKLIENVMQRIANQLLDVFPIENLDVKITKNPPVKGLNQVSVSDRFVQKRNSGKLGFG